MSKPRALKNSTHGKLETPAAENRPPSTYAQLLGDTGVQKYGTLDPLVYENQLNRMTQADLHVHATKNGIKPIHNRALIIKSLMAKFNKHANGFKFQIGPIEQKTLDVQDKVKDFLARAR